MSEARTTSRPTGASTTAAGAAAPRVQRAAAMIGLNPRRFPELAGRPCMPAFPHCGPVLAAGLARPKAADRADLAPPRRVAPPKNRIDGPLNAGQIPL